MSAAIPVDLAVAGCSTLVGEALLQLLADSELPLGQVHLLDREAGEKIEFKDRYLRVQDLASFDFGQVRLALFTVPEQAAEHAWRAAAAGCSVIDLSGRFRRDRQVPLVVPELDPGWWRGLLAGSIVASPSPAAVLLALALGPLQQAAGLERLDVTLCFPASMADRAGVEELAAQTAGLLNARNVTTRVFPKQLAFNLLPQVGGLQENGSSQTEADIVGELRRLLDPSLSIGLSVIQVPVFYGLAATVHLQTRERLTAADARQMLAETAGIRIMDGGEAGFPTPVTEAVHHDEVFLGRLRDDESRSKSLNFWIVADNVRKCAAINAIRLAEQLVRAS